MASGKFLVRLTPSLHTRLKARALALDVSLNDLCSNRLALAGPLESLPARLVGAIGDLGEIAGERLIGLFAFGSWARQDTHDLSDIDILVVLEPGTVVTREYYRRWEENAPENTRIEPHFVTLPHIQARVSGLWAEVSLDGIVIADTNGIVQKYLGRVRHLIASGRLVAKRIHGQNYWIHVEVA